MATPGAGEVEFESQESINVPELLLQGQDNREPAAESGQSNHGEHFAIFCLERRCKCPPCKGEGVGTCFLMSNLNDPDSKYFHFATCAHVLYCVHCKQYAHVNLQKQHERMLPDLGGFSETGDECGWARVPEAYKTKKSYTHDYGVLAVKKGCVLPKFGDKMQVAEASMIRVNPQSGADFYPKGFLCGYKTPEQLYCSGDGRDALDTKQYIDNSDQLVRQEEERTAAGLYVTEQNHFDGDVKGMRWEPSGSSLGKRLLRHYLASSAGQSGSPIRLQSGEVVGIHSSYRKSFLREQSDQRQGCNFGVHLLDDDVLSEMKQWVRAGGQST